MAPSHRTTLKGNWNFKEWASFDVCGQPRGPKRSQSPTSVASPFRRHQSPIQLRLAECGRLLSEEFRHSRRSAVESTAASFRSRVKGCVGTGNFIKDCDYIFPWERPELRIPQDCSRWYHLTRNSFVDFEPRTKWEGNAELGGCKSHP